MSLKVSLSEEADQFQQAPFIWKRNLWMIVRPIIIVTTSKEDTPNAALITNFMNVSVLQKLAFGCHTSHDTYRNIVATSEFVINVPSEA